MPVVLLVLVCWPTLGALQDGNRLSHVRRRMLGETILEWDEEHSSETNGLILGTRLLFFIFTVVILLNL